jgi:hypothetical protein
VLGFMWCLFVVLGRDRSCASDFHLTMYCSRIVTTTRNKTKYNEIRRDTSVLT